MLDLTTLLSYENPNRERLDEIIANERFATCPYLSDTYSVPQWGFIKDKGVFPSPMVLHRKKAYKFMREQLAAVPLIDLGCGDIFGYPGNVTMILAAKQLGLPAYIGVDKYNVGRGNRYAARTIESNCHVSIDDLSETLEQYKDENRASVFDDLAIEVVKADMLDFVSRLNSGVYNFTINGIDHAILHDNKGEYSQALAEELARASETGSVVFGGSSEIFYYLARVGFTLLDVPGNPRMKENHYNWIFKK